MSSARTPATWHKKWLGTQAVSEQIAWAQERWREQDDPELNKLQNLWDTEPDAEEAEIPEHLRLTGSATGSTILDTRPLSEVNPELDNKFNAMVDVFLDAASWVPNQ